jgi:hypothetical protein
LACSSAGVGSTAELDEGVLMGWLLRMAAA